MDLVTKFPKIRSQRLAFEKASDVAQRYPESWVLGADTIVVIDGRILGKPFDRAEAEYMLSTRQERLTPFLRDTRY